MYTSPDFVAVPELLEELVLLERHEAVLLRLHAERQYRPGPAGARVQRRRRRRRRRLRAQRRRSLNLLLSRLRRRGRARVSRISRRQIPGLCRPRRRRECRRRHLCRWTHRSGDESSGPHSCASAVSLGPYITHYATGDKDLLYGKVWVTVDLNLSLSLLFETKREREERAGERASGRPNSPLLPAIQSAPK